MRKLVCCLFASIAAGTVLLPNASFAATLPVFCRGVSDGALINRIIGFSQPGDTILFHGTCVTDQTVVLLGERNYYGESKNATTIRQASGANLRALIASDSWVNNSPTAGDPIRIEHLNIDGNSASNSGTNVLVIRSWLSRIEDVIVQNAPEDGIQVTSVSENGNVLTNTEVNGVIDDVWVKSSGANGIDVVDPGSWVTDWWLLDNAVQDSAQSAIYLQNCAGWMVRGNHVYGVGKDGIHASRCYGSSIEGNYIEQFGSSGGSGNTYYGIVATLQGSAASVVSGNKVFMFGGTANGASLRYIDVQGNYGATQASVIGNTILGHNGPTETGLTYLLGGASSLHVSSTGNSVMLVAAPINLGEGVTLDAGR
jgi:parallel beta-helix repeat protein